MPSLRSWIFPAEAIWDNRRVEVAATADDLCRDGCFGYEDHNQNPFHVWFKVVDVRKSGFFSNSEVYTLGIPSQITDGESLPTFKCAGNPWVRMGSNSSPWVGGNSKMGLLKVTTYTPEINGWNLGIPILWWSKPLIFSGVFQVVLQPPWRCIISKNLWPQIIEISMIPMNSPSNSEIYWNQQQGGFPGLRIQTKGKNHGSGKQGLERWV